MLASAPNSLAAVQVRRVTRRRTMRSWPQVWASMW